MIRLILLTTLRNFFRHRHISLLNLFGLVLGITAFLFTLQYLMYEFSYDSFFENHEQIYRVNLDITKQDQIIYHGAKTPRGLYDALKNDIPEVEANGIAYFEKCLVNYETTTFANQDILWVDDGFERVFPVEMLEGYADYSNPRLGIISETAAHALFGNKSPVGKIIGVNQGMPIEITGVFKDLPANTHLQAKYFASIKTWVEMGAIAERGDWRWNGWWNYVKLIPGASSLVVEDKINRLAEPHMNYLAEDLRNASFKLQPLSKLHYTSNLEGTMGASTNYSSLVNLIIIALVTLGIAWINYANLSTAHAQTRSVQIGLRRLFGASKTHQWLQTLAESSTINIVALIISVFIFLILRTNFATGFNISISGSYLPVSQMLLFLGGTIAVGIIFSSIYYGIQLTRLSLSGGQTTPEKGHFKKGLVIVQMSLSILFLICTMIVYQQISYMQNKQLGVSLNDVIICTGPASLNADGNKRQRFEAFKTDLLSNPDFIAANFNLSTPGQSPQYGYKEFINPNAEEQPEKLFFENQAGAGLLKTFDLELVAGSGFDENQDKNLNRILVNRMAMELLGINNPDEAIGQYVYRKEDQTQPLQIMGVVENFHNEGLQKAIYPIIWNNNFPSEFGYFSVRVNTNNIKNSIDQLGELWKRHYPRDDLNFVFADAQFNRQYESESRFGRFYLWLTLISIGIATIGLYALTVFFLQKRIKEIGVRKVNGARVADILFMLNKGFGIWVLIAFALSAPLAWFSMHNWLNHFAYKIEIEWYVFLFAGAISLVITLLTVTLKSWKTARRNPVEALRYE